MHKWSDSWFQEHGRDLDDAIWEIYHICTKYGRIGINSKEKYGTHRCSAYFWGGGLHDLIWPGYYRIQNKFIYFTLDEYVLRPLFRRTGLLWLGNKYQHLLYNYAFQKVCKKYPKIVDEIVADVDDAELIKPGLFGKIDGKIIRNKYWREV